MREYDRLFMDEAPDGHQDKDFMEFINPNSLNIVEAYVEPSLAKANIGDRFQFQRIGYFNVDDDATSDKLVFNKTVGLRDSWAKQKPKPQQNNPQHAQPKRPAIAVIKQLGKKYTNLPEEKQSKSRAEILKLAEEVSYEEIQPLFNTAVKKAGTRIAVVLVLSVLLKNGLERNAEIEEFIAKAIEDKNEILVAEATSL